jgi:hypothetical protein
MKRFACTFLFASTICLLAGCGGGGPSAPPPVAKVKGTVNLDGKPMPNGEIRFSVGAQAPRNLEVKDGAFSGEVYTGKNTVEVVQEKDAPNPMDPKLTMKVNMVDPKFVGPGSPLSADVPASGASDLKFDVTSKR